MELKSKLVTVRQLKKYYDIEGGFMKKKTGSLKAVDDVSFEVYQGETLGMVGESGCGKSTVGKSVLRVHPITAGNVIFNFDGEEMDVSEKPLNDLRINGFRKNSQMIFQDPNSSLDPRMTVMEIISEPLLYNANMNKNEIRDRTLHLMERVGLDSRYLKRYPHAFSGGQRQRISIARALSTNPKFIVADEPTSALDVSIQAQILNLMLELQQEYHMSYLFISHNLGVIRRVSDRVAVMYLGRIVELAQNEAFFERPRHPYSEALMKSVPIADPTVKSGMESAPGEVGNPLNPPSGCYFHPRCPYAKDVCKEVSPAFRDLGNEHFTACHLADDISLEGIKGRRVTGAAATS
jgi:peptide/nickel transport system ATP-binding protein